MLPAAGTEPSGAFDSLASILKRTSKQHHFSLEQASVSQTRVILPYLSIYSFKFLRQYSQEPLSTRSSRSKILVISFGTIPPLQFKTCESDTPPPALWTHVVEEGEGELIPPSQVTRGQKQVWPTCGSQRVDLDP